MIKKILNLPTEWALFNFVFIGFSVLLSYYAGFCWFTDSLSRFGTTNDFFNFSLILSGISLGIFTISVVDKSKFNWWGRIFLLASSLLLVFLGIFTEEYFIHFVFAVSLFTFFPFGLLLFGHDLKEHNRNLGIFTKVTAIMLIILWVASFIIWLWFFKLGLAIPEIISLIIWIVWAIVFVVNYRNPKK